MIWNRRKHSMPSWPDGELLSFLLPALLPYRENTTDDGYTVNMPSLPVLPFYKA